MYVCFSGLCECMTRLAADVTTISAEMAGTCTCLNEKLCKQQQLTVTGNETKRTRELEYPRCDFFYLVFYAELLCIIKQQYHTEKLCGD